MWNVCFGCGEYRADKIVERVEPGWARAVCPACGHSHPFLQLPLLVVSGASGAGKSAVCGVLAGSRGESVLLDADLLWRAEFDRPETGCRDFFESWLRLCKNIAQSGRPVTLFGAGVGVPENLERCVERRYLGAIHRLALVCDDEVLAARLRARPSWRESGDEEQIARQIEFNGWLAGTGHSEFGIELLDSGRHSLEHTAERVAAWILGKC